MTRGGVLNRVVPISEVPLYIYKSIGYPTVFIILIWQGMSELPDFNKILFPHMPAIPLEEVVPEAPNQVRLIKSPQCVQLACTVKPPNKGHFSYSEMKMK